MTVSVATFALGDVVFEGRAPDATSAIAVIADSASVARPKLLWRTIPVRLKTGTSEE